MITKLAVWILQGFGYNIEGGRWVQKGGGGAGVGDNNILCRLAKQMLMYLVSKHNGTLILPRHTLLPLRMTHSAALAKKGPAMCHQALTLQIASHAGPNYNNHTNRATHRPT